MAGWLRRWGPHGALGALTLFVSSCSALYVWVANNPRPMVIVGKVPLDRPVHPPTVLVVDQAPPHREPPPPAPPPVAPGPAEVKPQVKAKPRAPTGGVPRFTAPRVQGLWAPNGKPPGPARYFADPVDDYGGLIFAAVFGSDARTGNPMNARSDSIHIIALDPGARRGTIVGIPRDSWIDVPGHGKRRVNEALRIGGPELAVQTLRQATGMPITYYLVTAFEGMRAMVNELNGVDAFVPYDMNDPNSGAFFQRGWHRMHGEQALAFSRNRHIPGGDFGRSENQGRLMLDGLKKLRAETGSHAELEGWLSILLRHTKVNLSFPELLRLATLARATAASDITNVVAPGRTGLAGAASVVFLTDQAYALFRDVAEDAVVNGSYPRFGPADAGAA